MNFDRGSFPKAKTPETTEQKRTRYEQWVLATRIPACVDPIADAIDTVPHVAAAIGKPTTRASNMLSIRARCWQCVAGDSDAGGTGRIADCASRDCALWSVRPYKTKDEPLPAPVPVTAADGFGNHQANALARPGARGYAIKGYCFSCCGGKRETSTMKAVANCPAVTCALWSVRPAGLVDADSSCKPDENSASEAAVEPNALGELP